MYRIEYLSAADRDLQKFDHSVRKRILKDIEKLACDPRPRGVVKLSATDEIYRVKVGPGKNHRVLYQIEDVALPVLIVKVGDRKEVYRAL